MAFPLGNNKILRYWIVSAIVLGVVIPRVKCLKCVQCSTFDDPIGCASGNIEPKPCPYDNQTYCSKYETILPKGQKFAIRDCIDNVTSVGCEKMTSDGTTINICYLYCNQDGCNTSSPTASGQALFLVVAISMLKHLVKCVV